MKKLLYIIKYIILMLFTIVAICSIEIYKQEEAKITVLTQQNAVLTAQISTLQSTVDKQAQTVAELTKENEQLKVQRIKEAEKTDRSCKRPRYSLTDAERDLVERVVMAEAQGESLDGQMLVAQCVLNACEIDGIRPGEAIKKYVYAKARPEPSDSVKDAVSAVFDKGETVTDEPIVYFYAPGRVRSKFHESQRFIVEVGGHRFFTEGG